MSEWINVKDRLPDIGEARHQQFIVFDGKYVRSAFFETYSTNPQTYEGWVDHLDQDGCAVYPTHWMSLPQPPEES